MLCYWNSKQTKIVKSVGTRNIFCICKAPALTPAPLSISLSQACYGMFIALTSLPAFFTYMKTWILTWACPLCVQCPAPSYGKEWSSPSWIPYAFGSCVFPAQEPQEGMWLKAGWGRHCCPCLWLPHPVPYYFSLLSIALPAMNPSSMKGASFSLL